MEEVWLWCGRWQWRPVTCSAVRSSSKSSRITPISACTASSDAAPCGRSFPPVDRLSVAGPSSTIPVAAAAPPAVGGPRGVSAPSCIRIPSGNVYPSRASIAFPSSKPPPYHDDQLATSWQTVARTNWSAVSSFRASSTSRRTQRSPASAWRNDESTTGTHL